MILMRKPQELYVANYILYHHTSVIVTIWILIKFFATGQVQFVFIINSLAHMIIFGFKFIADCWTKRKLYRYKNIVGFTMMVSKGK